MTATKVPISVGIEYEDWVELRKLAEVKTRGNLSELVREIIKEYLEVEA